MSGLRLEPARSTITIRRCIANSERLTARLSGSRVGELPPQLFTGCVHLAPQNSPQIASRAVFSRRLALSLLLVKCYDVVSRRLVKSVLTLCFGLRARSRRAPDTRQIDLMERKGSSSTSLFR